jgi:polysaccharide biosynthesis transport protein
MQHSVPQSSIDLRSLLLVVRRRQLPLASGGLFGVVLAIVLLALIPPRYTATTALLVDSREERILNDAVVSPFRATANAIASEVAVIGAPSVLRRVADKLELARDPDFEVPAPAHGVFATAKAQLFTMFGFGVREANSGDATNDPMIEVLEKLRKSIEVIPSQNLLYINVTGRDPGKAARIANALADAYLDQQLEGRYNATRRATKWLKEKLEEHKVKLRLSEERYERFKAQMDLVEKEGVTLEEKQLVRLNEEIVMARARTAEARAKYGSINEHPSGQLLTSEQLSQIAQSTLITALRTQLAQVTRDENGLSARFGYYHSGVTRARAERLALTKQIDDEVRRIVAVLKSDFEVATSREASLQDSLSSATVKTSSQKPEYVRLRELQREAESDRALYEAMLQRMKQAAAQESWKTTDFRVVAEAVPPLGSSQPKTKVVVVGSLALGLGLGIGFTLLAELLNETFKRGRDVEAKLGIPHIVDVPLMPGRQPRVGDPTATLGQSAFHFAAQHVGSAFADAMLGLHSSLQLASRDSPIKTVMFTSAASGEGKSVVAANFAQTAARSGLKVLLICTDLRTPTVNWFEPAKRAKVDLVDYLNGNAEIEATVAHSDQSMIDLISAPRTVANAASLLSSPRMDRLLEWAKANYDLVVIDTVAIVTCLDGRMLARRVDATVVVIEWLKTRVDVAKEAVDLLLRNDARIAGAVLNKVDFAKGQLYGLNTVA